MSRFPRNYTVYVYNNHQEYGKHTNRPLAYLRYQTPRACIHIVNAFSGVEAKKLALSLHKLCSQSDEYCSVCNKELANSFI